MSKEIESAVNDLLSTASIEFVAVYMGETAKAWSGDNKPNIMDQWQVKFRSPGKEISEFYFTGLGHRQATAIGKTRPESKFPKNTNGYADWAKMYVKPVKPSSAGVLYSLLTDAGAMHESFNDWCDNYGYDSDSITAFRTYQDCCEIGKKLCQIFTKDEADKLREMLQDY